MIAKAAIFLLLTAALHAEDAQAIMRKAVANYTHNQETLANYTYRVLDTDRELDGTGKVKATHSTLREIIWIDGREHRRLLEKDGKPLPPSEARHDEVLSRKQNDRESLTHIPAAYDLAIVGEPEINGRPTWQIRMTPRAGYNGPDSAVLRHMEGTMWIDKNDYAWVRIEADARENITFGLFLARISKGTRVELDRTRLNDEVWALHTIKLKATARLALVKSVNAEAEILFTDYRRFRTDSRIVEAESQPQP